MSASSQQMKLLLCAHQRKPKYVWETRFTWFKTCLQWFVCLGSFSCMFMSSMFVCCVFADIKVQLMPIKDTCVYLWGWGPCPPHRKVHSSELFPAVWCQNYIRHPSESLEEDGGHIWAARAQSIASLKKTETTKNINKRPEHKKTRILSWVLLA